MILSNVSDAIIMTDINFNILSLNNAAESIYKLKTEDIKGKNWVSIVPIEYINQTDEEVMQQFISQGWWVGEVIQTNGENKRLHVLASVTQLNDKDGNPIGVVAINRDITDRVRAEDELKKSEKRFRLALEDAPFPIILYAEDGEIVMINRACQKLSGYNEADFTTIEKWTSQAFESQQQAKLLFDSIKNIQKSVYQGIFQIKTQSGKLIQWDFHSIPLDKLNDGRQLIMSIAVDVTEQLMLQEQALQAQVLEARLNKERELSELKERLMSTISHEFRTPLTVIQTSSDMLQNYYYKLDDAKRQKHLNRISEQVKSATRLLDQTMKLRHATSGRVEFLPAPIDIEMFSQTIFDKMSFADNSRHTMEYICEVEQTKIHADANLLEHILENLLSNALKYTPEHKKVCMQIYQTDTDIIIKVTDEGIGIPEKDLERLFEPYHRASNVGNIQGTGLGLAIVREYIEMHNGSVDVDSRVGVGTSFSVALPI